MTGHGGKPHTQRQSGLPRPGSSRLHLATRGTLSLVRPPALYLSLTRECLWMPDLSLASRLAQFLADSTPPPLPHIWRQTRNFAIEPYCRIWSLAIGLCHLRRIRACPQAPNPICFLYSESHVLRAISIVSTAVWLWASDQQSWGGKGATGPLMQWGQQCWGSLNGAQHPGVSRTLKRPTPGLPVATTASLCAPLLWMLSDAGQFSGGAGSGSPGDEESSWIFFIFIFAL